MRRITGASLKGSRPAQISTSAWRGEKAWRSMPKRAKSKRLAAVAMNSMAQQAVPNGIGHNEFARDQLIRSSSRASSQLGLCPATSWVCTTCFIERSVPLEGSPLPHVHVPHEQDGQEHQHLGEQEAHARGPGPSPVAAGEVDRRPGDQEHGLDIEYNKEHGDQIELDRKALVRVTQGGHAALVRGQLGGCGSPRREQVRGADDQHGVRHHEHRVQQERDIGLVHGIRRKITLWECLVNRSEWRKSRWDRYIARRCPSSPIAGSATWRATIA